MRLIAFAFTFIMSTQAFALKPVLFGPEFALSPSQKGLSSHAVWERMKMHLIGAQPDGAKFTETVRNNRLALDSPNGWWLSWYWDRGSMEVQTMPMTVEQFKHFKNDLQDAIFVSAANELYFPELWRGGGHINIDLENFRENRLLYRNFVADMLNHNELFLGIFNYDIRNATPHEAMPIEDAQYNILPQLFEPQAAFDILDQQLHGEASFETMTEVFKKHIRGYSFSFYKMDKGRIELRAVRPQASMDVWIRQIELIEARLKYLEKFTTPIPYQQRVQLLGNPWLNRSLPPVHPQEALKSFYTYVTETGLKWQDHRDYLWPQWMWRQNENVPSELEIFENSVWFLNQEAKAKCERHLGVGT